MLMDRDKEILRFLSLLKFLNTRQIESLIPYQGKTQSIIVVRKRMRELEKEGLVLSFQPSAYDSKVFYLSKKGVDFCIREFANEDLKPYKRSDKIDHSLRVSDFYISLWRAEKEGYHIEKFNLSIEFNIRGKILRPDIFFLLSSPDKKGRLGLVEIDQGTETLTYILRNKLPNYEGLYRNQGFQKKYRTFPQVYFFMPSKERANTLLTRLEKEKKTPIIFRTTTFDTLENLTAFL